MTTAPQPKAALLESLASQFGPFPKQNQSLERHRLAVLTLRARGGSYPQIRKLLASQGIYVSDTSLSRFCCKYDADVARLRLQVEQELDGLPAAQPTPSPAVISPRPSLSISSVSSPSTQIAPSSRKQRDLRGDV